jgi:hypothetical protein
MSIIVERGGEREESVQERRVRASPSEVERGERRVLRGGVLAGCGRQCCKSAVEDEANGRLAALVRGGAGGRQPAMASGWKEGGGGVYLKKIKNGEIF